MTEMAHYLLRPDQNGAWVRVVQLTLKHDYWMLQPEWLWNRERDQIDWGTFRYEVTKAELLQLVAAPSNLISVEQQDKLLASLPEDGRYAVEWEEGI